MWISAWHEEWVSSPNGRRGNLSADADTTSDKAFYSHRSTSGPLPAGTMSTRTTGSYASRWLRHTLNGTT